MASWTRYDEAVDEHGAPIDVVDQLRDVLFPDAAAQRNDELAFIRNRDVFGDLVDNDQFVEAYRAILQLLHEQRRARRSWPC